MTNHFPFHGTSLLCTLFLGYLLGGLEFGTFSSWRATWMLIWELFNHASDASAVSGLYRILRSSIWGREYFSSKIDEYWFFFFAVCPEKNLSGLVSELNNACDIIFWHYFEECMLKCIGRTACLTGLCIYYSLLSP